MSKFAVRMDRIAGIDEEISFGVIARVQGYASEDPDKRVFHQVSIPTSKTKTATVEVRPGRYIIQAVLPSGAILQEEREINDGQTVPIVFAAPARRPWLGWQDFSASAPNVDLPAETASSWRTFDRIGKLFNSIPLFDRIFGSGAPVTPRGGRLSDRDVVRPNKQPRVALVSLESYDWPSAAGEPALDAELQAGEALSARESEGSLTLWNVTPPIPRADTRNWAAVDLGDALELVSLPLPWRSGRGDIASAELLVDTSDVGGSARSSLTIRDPSSAALLAYLARGNLALARSLIQQMELSGVVEETIGAKSNNPFAACAAAYVGLAAFDPAERETWDPWLANLMERYPRIPDGAVLHAKRIINRPAPNEDRAAVLQALRRAFEAGIPYFTAGIMHLRESLTLYAHEDEDIRAMRDAVARIASLVDPSKVFTVIRYPKTPRQAA